LAPERSIDITIAAGVVRGSRVQRGACMCRGPEPVLARASAKTCDVGVVAGAANEIRSGAGVREVTAT